MMAPAEKMVKSLPVFLAASYYVKGGFYSPVRPMSTSATVPLYSIIAADKLSLPQSRRDYRNPLGRRHVGTPVVVDTTQGESTPPLAEGET